MGLASLAFSAQEKLRCATPLIPGLKRSPRCIQNEHGRKLMNVRTPSLCCSRLETGESLSVERITDLSAYDFPASSPTTEMAAVKRQCGHQKASSKPEDVKGNVSSVSGLIRANQTIAALAASKHDIYRTRVMEDINRHLDIITHKAGEC